MLGRGELRKDLSSGWLDSLSGAAKEVNSHGRRAHGNYFQEKIRQLIVIPFFSWKVFQASTQQQLEQGNNVPPRKETTPGQALFPLPEIRCSGMFSQQSMVHIHPRFQRLLKILPAYYQADISMFCLKGRTTAPIGWAAQEGSSSNKNFGVSGIQFCSDHVMLQDLLISPTLK